MAKGKKNKFQNEEEPEGKGKKLGKVMMTEDQLMDKHHMDRTQFIPLLPTQSLYPEFHISTSNALLKIVQDLNHLLYCNFKCFWSTVLHNSSLKNCLTSCLSFLHRQWLNPYISPQDFQQNRLVYDSYARVKNETYYEYTEALAKVVITLFYRLVSCHEENAELAEIHGLGEALCKYYILDTVRLLDFIEIFGASSKDITKVIVKKFLKLRESEYKNFSTYRELHEEIIPLLGSKMREVVTRIKVLTDREDFGINYSYKRLRIDELSPGEEELKRKVSLILEIISYIQTINNLLDFFPSDCKDSLYFTVDVHLCSENLFFELDVAYKVWNFQTQEKRLLPMFNYCLLHLKNYFVSFFERCNDIIVLRKVKSNTIGAYIKALERIFKDYGRRTSLGKKGAAPEKRVLSLYNLIINDFDLLAFMENIYNDEMENQTYQINIEYLVDFKVTIEDYHNKQQPRRVEPDEIEISENETQLQEQQQQQEHKQPHLSKNQGEEKSEKQSQQQPMQLEDSQKKEIEQRQSNFSMLQRMVPKKQREDDYYENLYKKYHSRCNQEYQDEYDDLVDHDKKPLFIDEESSNSDSDSENQRHLVSNNLNQQKALNRKKSHGDPKPKYIPVHSNTFRNQERPAESKQYNNNNNKQWAEKGTKNEKQKYVEKSKKQENSEEQFHSEEDGDQPSKRNNKYAEKSGKDGYQKHNKNDNSNKNAKKKYQAKS